MGESLKIGVVGAGVFGSHHARKCAGHDRVALTGVCDVDKARAEALARELGTEALSMDALASASDALIIASPASTHEAAAKVGLRAGCHLLIEKPIAATVEAAEALVAQAASSGLVLQVGHQERFVASAIGLDHIDEPPLAIRAWRHTPWSERGTDVGVTLDLMTHDIDLVLWMLGEEPEHVSGEVERVKSSHSDRADAVFQFSQTTAWLSASRVADAPRRELELDFPDGTMRIDFLAKSLENATPHPVIANFGDDPKAQDSLAAALDGFVSAVLDGTPVPITGGMGLRALRYAVAVEASRNG